ncbi:MAG: hypothetical protein WC943_06645 [Elusimicrobiota bacterium]|jgi:tetratricopeptide (TPR) repeat protein
MNRALPLLALSCCACLAACSGRHGANLRLDPIVTDDVLSSAAARPSDSEVAASIKAGVRLIRRGRYEDAGKQFAAGLRLDPTDSNLHFLNALSYHLRSLSGDHSMLDFAEAGYALSLRFDSGNHWAAYLLGHVYFQQQRFVDAQNQFSYALLFAPENPVFLRSLAAASYYAKSLDLSHWAAEKALKADPNNADGWRAAVITRAAVGDAPGAKQGLETYNNLLASLPAAPDTAFASAAERVEDWRDFHHSLLLAQGDSSSHPSVFGSDAKPEGHVIELHDTGASNYDDSMAQPAPQTPAAAPVPAAVPAPAPAPAPAAPAPADQPASPADPSPAPAVEPVEPRADLPKMTLVDVVIIRTEENRSESKGVNLLDALKATLTGTLYAFNRVTGYSTNGAGAMARTHTFSPSLALAGLQYNLNIFNDGVNKAEVLARPSLLAVDNKPSTFYSGAVLHVQLDSNNSDGSMVDVPIGITLSVTPTFLDAETVSINVHAERGFIDSRNEKLGFSVYSQTSRTSVDATAVMRFGETLVLSGLSENATDRTKSGVPFLQRIPGVQYLFSRRTLAETKNSVLILMSPNKQRYADDITPEKVGAADLPPAPQSAHTQALRRRAKVPVRTNVDAAIAELGRGRYLREIRTGDLRLDMWHNSDSIVGALKRALGFLYY